MLIFVIFFWSSYLLFEIEISFSLRIVSCSFLFSLRTSDIGTLHFFFSYYFLFFSRTEVSSDDYSDSTTDLLFSFIVFVSLFLEFKKSLTIFFTLLRFDFGSHVKSSKPSHFTKKKSRYLIFLWSKIFSTK